jgi:putative serine/threonine protein kinase
MKHEATMLEKANSINVGPKLLGYSDNFLLMELIEGQLMDEWIEQHSSERDKDVVKNVLRESLDQCFRLDCLELDHGELSQARRHLLVYEDHPRIVDFETASTSRKPANLSSICQYIFVSSNLALRVGTLLGRVELDQLIQALSIYKKERSTTAFAGVLRACKLL